MEYQQDLLRGTYDDVNLLQGNITQIRNTQDEILRNMQTAAARPVQIQETQERHTQNLNTVQDIIQGFEERFENLNEILQAIEEPEPPPGA